MFNLILADPPWHFRNWSADAPGEIHDRGRGAAAHYPTMTTDDIKALIIPAAPDAVLLLWATWPHLPDALVVIRAWGFAYKTLAWVWVKANRTGFGFFRGMGYWTRANSEPCLLATKGEGLPRLKRDVSALIYAPVREHSRKPDEQYAKIGRLFVDCRRLELFARRQQPGWAVWGNEVESSIELSSTEE